MSSVEAPIIDIRASALSRFVSAIETATTLDELLLLSLSEFAYLLAVSHGAVLMLNDHNTSSRLLSTYPPRVTMPPPVPVEQTPNLQRVIETRQPVQIYDAQAMSPASVYIKMMQDDQVGSLLIVPLISQDHVRGALVLGSMGKPRHFTDNEMVLARILTGQLAAAITSFAISDAVQRRSAELATLNDISSAVTSLLDTQEIYHVVVEKLNEYFRVEAGSLLMRDDKTGDLTFVMTLEGGVEKLAGVVVPRGKGVVGYVAEKQRYAIVHNPLEDPRFYSKISEDTGYPPHSILCVPMVVKGRTIGVIEMLNKREGNFTEEDANRLMRMANTIGVAIENARLFQEVATGRDRLEAILNSNNDGILMADMHGVVVTVNPKATQILQTFQGDLLGRKLTDLLDDLRARALDVSLPPWLTDSEQTPEIVEFELSIPGYSFIRQLLLLVRDTGGATIGRLALLQDISKERELTQLRDDYMGMLVHDLRAPLTAIMNGIMMVRRGMGGPVSAQQSELLGIAYQSSQTMLEMVNTLLDISKMEQGRMTLNVERFSITDVLDETLDRLRASAEGHEITLIQQVPSNVPPMEADREKIVRILQNLLDNAIKYSPNGSSVTIGTSCIQLDRHQRIVGGNTISEPEFPNISALPLTLPSLLEGSWQLFWVRDQGPGIPPQYQERIFEKFGQVRGRKVRGTGLGLTFCKLATEAHGGKIWVESTEGEGSIFALVLPRGKTFSHT